jgi:hypothetical protein
MYKTKDRQRFYCRRCGTSIVTPSLAHGEYYFCEQCGKYMPVRQEPTGSHTIASEQGMPAIDASSRASSDQLHDPEDTKPPQSKRPLVKCDICGNLIRANRLRRHRRKVHFEDALSPTARRSFPPSMPALPPGTQYIVSAPWDDRDSSTSVRTISGGGFETSRRRH